MDFYVLPMRVMRRLLIAVLLVFGLILVPQTPAQICTMSMPAPSPAKCTKCCATMKSCVMPRQNPTQPTSAWTSNTAPIMMIAPALAVLLRELPATPVTFPRSAAQRLTDPTPQLAVLCTFLI